MIVKFIKFGPVISNNSKEIITEHFSSIHLAVNLIKLQEFEYILHYLKINLCASLSRKYELKLLQMV